MTDSISMKRVFAFVIKDDGLHEASQMGASYALLESSYQPNPLTELSIRIIPQGHTIARYTIDEFSEYNYFLGEKS